MPERQRLFVALPLTSDFALTMKDHLLRIVILALIALCYDPPTLPQTAHKTKAGTIAGRVLVRGRGLGGVFVAARESSVVRRRVFATTKTDADGNYAISGLPTGTYYLSVSAPEFIAISGGEPTDEMRPITLVTGETVSGMDFQLVRGGVLTGRVSSKDGDPIIEEQVSLIPVDQRSDLSSTSTIFNLNNLTDDRGIYRIFGIPPGRYKVAAGAVIAAYSSYMGKRAHKRFFHPGVVDESKARIIDVKEGLEIRDVNIGGIDFEPTFNISGRVIDGTTGVPVPNLACGLEVISGDRMVGGLSGPSFSDTEGRFIIENIPAGRYRITAPSRLLRADLSSPPFFWRLRTF